MNPATELITLAVELERRCPELRPWLDDHAAGIITQAIAALAPLSALDVSFFTAVDLVTLTRLIDTLRLANDTSN